MKWLLSALFPLQIRHTTLPGWKLSSRLVLFDPSQSEKSWSYGNGSDEPIVQVLHTDNGRFQTFSSGFDSVKIVCLTVIDRDGNRLLARVAAHLTDTAVHLRPGHVLRLRVFNDMLMKPHANSPPTAVIVVVQMDVIGSGPFLMSEEDMITPTRRWTTRATTYSRATVHVS